MAKVPIVNGEYDRYRFKPADKGHWEEIAAAVAPDGIKCIARLQLHRKIHACLDKFLAVNAAWAASPGPKVVRKDLQRVIAAASKLNDTLSKIGTPASHLLSRHLTSFRPIEDAILDVTEIFGAATQAMKKLPTHKGGPAPNAPLITLVRDLDEVFFGETGKRASRRTYDAYKEETRDTPGFRFVTAALALVGRDSSGIDDRIRKTKTDKGRT